MSESLTRIRVSGFQSLNDVELEPGRITVLIGPNGGGKSNLLSAIQMVPVIDRQLLRRFVGQVGGASALLHYGPRVTQEITLRLEFEEATGGGHAYDVRLGY